MIVQAEHIPVHLGAMPDAVAAVMRDDPAPDDVFILNDPFTGGTHLPDITLVSRTALGFAASRAHHADVGGVEPGSMPRDVAHARRGRRRHPADAARRRDARRARRADAQPGGAPRRPARAARGARASPTRRIDDVCARHGRERVAAAMDELYDYSERLVRAGIADDARRPLRGERLPRRRHARSPSTLHDRRRRDRARLRRHRPAAASGNLNCPLAVTRSACYFVVRCLAAPRRPRVRRRVRARDRARAGRLARQRAAARSGRRRQRRDLEPHRRRRLRGVRTGHRRCPRRARER